MERESLDALLQNYFLPLRLHKTPREILNLATHPDSTLEQFTDVLERNQAYVHFFDRLTQMRQSQVKWTEERDNEAASMLPTHRMVSTFGKAGTRNLVLSISLLKTLGTSLPRSTEDNLEVKPSDMLKRAMVLTDIMEEQRMAHMDISVLGALLFDCLEAYTTKHIKQPKAAHEYLANCWKEGFAFSQIAYHLSKNVKDFPKNKFTMAAALVIYAGKYLMYAGFPTTSGQKLSWPDFIKKTEDKLKLCPEISNSLQRENFGTCHSELAGLVALFFPNLEEICDAVTYYQEPAYLESKPNDSHVLGVLLYLAQELLYAGSHDKIKRRMTQWGSFEKSFMADLKLNESHLEYALKKVSSK